MQERQEMLEMRDWLLTADGLWYCWIALTVLWIVWGCVGGIVSKNTIFGSLDYATDSFSLFSGVMGFGWFAYFIYCIST